MDIETTKYILSNLIANKKQMNKEVIYSTARQTVLWSTKGDKIKHQTFDFFFSFSFLFSSCFNWSHNCENHIHIWPKNLYLFTTLLKQIKALESNCSDTYKIYSTEHYMHHRWWHTSKAPSFHWRFSSSSLTSWEVLLGLWRPSLRDAILAVSPSTLPLAPIRKIKSFFFNFQQFRHHSYTAIISQLIKL